MFQTSLSFLMFCWEKKIGEKMSDPGYFQLKVVPPKHNFSNSERKLGTNKEWWSCPCLLSQHLFLILFLFSPINSASFSVLCRYLLFFVLHLFFFPLLSFPFAFRRFCCLKLSIDFLTGSRFWSFNHFFFFCWEMSVYIIYLLFNILLLKLETWNCVLFLCAIIVYWHPDIKKNIYWHHLKKGHFTSPYKLCVSILNFHNKLCIYFMHCLKKKKVAEV